MNTSIQQQIILGIIIGIVNDDSVSLRCIDV